MAAQYALEAKQSGQVAEARRRGGMLGAERLLPYRQRALVERPCPCIVALVVEQDGEVV
jgi:hypothetical protein